MAIASESSTSRRSTTLTVWWLYLLAVSIPFYGYSFFNLGDRGLLRPDWIFAGLLVLAFLLRGRVLTNVTEWFVIVLNIAALISMARLFSATDAQLVDFVTLYGQLLFMSLLFFAIASVNLTEEQLKIVVRVWLFIAALVASYGIYEFVAVKLDLPLLPIQITNPSIKEIGTGSAILWDQRVGSFLAEPGYLGSILIPPLVILMFLLIYGQSQNVLFRNNLMNWIVVSIFFLALVFTASIASYAVIALVALLIFLRLRKRPTSFGRALFAGSALLLLLILVISQTGEEDLDFKGMVLERLGGVEQGTDGSLQVRQAQAIIGLQVWMSHPILGVGFNNYDHVAVNFDPPAWYTSWVPVGEGAGNMWILLLAELGIIGFLAAAAVWLSLLIRLGRVAARLARPEDAFSVIMVAFFYVVLADLIQSLAHGSLVETKLWFELGLANMWLVHWMRRQSSKTVLLGRRPDENPATGYARPLSIR